MSKQDFEIVKDHEFKVKEVVFVIDPNGYDIWEANITAVDGNKYSVHYPDFPNEDTVLDDKSRILVDTRVNRRIYNNQETARNSKPIVDSSDEEDAEEEEESEDSDEGNDYKPIAPPLKEGKTKKNKKKKGKKNLKKEAPMKPRPEGARISPRRGA